MTATRPLIWTFTMLDAFENCNYKGFRKYLAEDRLPYIEGAAQAHGNRVHKVFEKAINFGEPLPDDMAHWQHYLAAIQNRMPRAELKLGVGADGRPRPFFDCDDGDGRGTLDVVMVSGTTAVFLDWKTSKKPREDPRELAIQALLLKAARPELTRFYGHYVWLTPNRLGQCHDVSDTAATWKRVRSIVSNIRTKLAADWFPKNENPLCPWCDVPKTDCEFRRDIPNGR